MKNKLILATTLLLCSLSLAAKERVFERSIQLAKPDKPAKIEVMVMNGAITVEGYKGDTVQVLANAKHLEKVDKKKAKKVKNSQPEKSKKGLKRVTNTALKLQIESKGNSLSIASINRNQHVNLVLKVPFNSNLEMHLMQGDDININNVKGSIDVQNIRGDIRAIGITGPIVAESMGKELVVVFDKFDTSKPSSLNAHRGDIDISLPKKSKVLVEVKNYQGEIYSGLDVEFASVDSVEEDDSGESNHMTIIGGSMAAAMNGGTQKLMINSFKGDIFVRKH